VPINFSQQERKDLTRRQLNIATENTNFANAKTKIDANKDTFQNVDNVNKQYYDQSERICDNYQKEIQGINGEQRAILGETIIHDAAYLTPSNELFPFTGTPHLERTPKVISKINGPVTGNDSTYEQEILPRLETWLNYLLDGFNDGATSGSLLTDYDQAGFESDVTFVSGQRILVADTNGVVLALFDSASPTGTCDNPLYTTQVTCEANAGIWTPGNDSLTLQIPEIIPATPTNPLTGANIQNFHPGFTNTERNDFLAGDYVPYLNYLAQKIKDVVAELKVKLQFQKTQLDANEEKDATRKAQNQTALNAVNAALSAISTWEALSDTGVNGKFVDTNIGPIDDMVADRVSFIPTRLPQLTASLGSVDANDPLNASTPGAYLERYKNVNLRANKLTGSLSRVAQQDRASSGLDALVTANTSAKALYDQDFRTEKIVQNPNGNDYVIVANATGFAVLDPVFVIEEQAAEISTSIFAIEDLIIDLVTYKKITLTTTVSASYSITRQLRLTKAL
jgi:hypothetical protein